MDTTPSSPSPAPAKRGLRIAIVAAVVVVVLIGGGLFLFLRDTAPPAANISSATQGITTGTKAPGGTSTTRAGTAGSTVTTTAGVTGSTAADGSASSTTSSGSASPSAVTWTVDPSVTSDAGGSFGGFRVAEVLSVGGSTTATGRSTDVSGTIEIEGSTLVSGTITVDLTTMTSDRQMRDGAMHRALGTSQFPEATFTIDGPIDLGVVPADGATVSIELPGTFTIHGTTKATTVKVDATITQGVLAVVGSTPFTFADYGISKPTAQSVVSIEDSGTIELQLYLTQS